MLKKDYIFSQMARGQFYLAMAVQITPTPTCAWAKRLWYLKLWATRGRNLVSAINVAYGGRDFSVTIPNRGYAIGGIFTDGVNSNDYYNQPMNDQKDLANSITYQMINNFSPVYVDVKDIKTQTNLKVISNR